MVDSHLTTGLPGLDRLLGGLMPGDNLVWQVDSVDDYLPFVEPCRKVAAATGRRLVYFRFAKHAPLLPEGPDVNIHRLEPEGGFERFISEIHKVVQNSGDRGFHVFDCLSDLAADWYSDRMLGNFFRLTCPHVYDVSALAYFAVLKNHHSVHASGTIAETTQILLDVYRHQSKLYLHPIKVQHRHSPTMFMLHAWERDTFRPVTDSATISEILTATPWAASEPARSRLGVWRRELLEAEDMAEQARRSGRAPDRASEHTRRLLRMAVSRDERILRMASEYFTLDDILAIWRRIIGSGLIGGKSVGMLLARAILNQVDRRWAELLETHDSFYIGSDVFYTYLVQNGCWWVRAKQRDPNTFLEGAEEARRRILTGSFAQDMLSQFLDILDYFGQSPIIVRSSSLLEDAFGNSFAGKYESVFCANQGSREKRLADFTSAVRTIYASTMSENALRYRAQRGILDRDEQMSLLVQRVSGSLHGRLFYPQVAGVGLSFNPYVWSDQIDPKAGVLRLVFGLGTRAVERSDDDYTRVVALNAPDRRPEAGHDQIRRYTQRKVDVLDLAANQLTSAEFSQVVEQSPDLPLRIFASRDPDLERLAAHRPTADASSWALTFERLLSETSFVADMRQMLQTLQAAYGCPVDVEFTANFSGKRTYRINLVQCRPLQVAGNGHGADLPSDIERDKLVFDARGAIVGQSRGIRVDRLIQVVPSAYGRLSISDRYAIARLIGRLMHLETDNLPENIMLLGPGRWGTTTPPLGVPVSFAEISSVSVLCEIVAMRENLIPDVSLGTHFFNEMVEADILYLALFPGREGNFLNEDWLARAPNKLGALLPNAAGRADVLRVIDAADLDGGRQIKLVADNLKQKAVCYLQQGEDPS
ncbi:MAG TPA: PEP/pyruvate-binding domain-containing protein [Phycisphaerae bacterium]|nr:PEP/pyruvate-binding domain-containing protein [Phycisphaerae bacterium]